MFQSVIKSTDKVPIGALHTVVMSHSPYFLDLKGIRHVFFAAKVVRKVELPLPLIKILTRIRLCRLVLALPFPKL